MKVQRGEEEEKEGEEGREEEFERRDDGQTEEGRTIQVRGRRGG